MMKSSAAEPQGLLGAGQRHWRALCTNSVVLLILFSLIAHLKSLNSNNKNGEYSQTLCFTASLSRTLPALSQGMPRTGSQPCRCHVANPGPAGTVGAVPAPQTPFMLLIPTAPGSWRQRSGLWLQLGLWVWRGMRWQGGFSAEVKCFGMREDIAVSCLSHPMAPWHG